MNEDIRKLNSNERFCCQQMIDEGWYVSMQSDKSIRLEEDYSCHYINNAKYCPFCANNLSELFIEKEKI